MSATAASNTTKSSGLNWLMKINTSGNNNAPSYAIIGSQQSGKMDFKNKAIDVTGKDDNGWDAYIPGQNNWTFDCGGVIPFSDAGFQQCQTAMKNRTAVYITVTGANSSVYTGNAIITNLAMDFPHDKATTFTISFQGDQALDVFTEV